MKYPRISSFMDVDISGLGANPVIILDVDETILTFDDMLTDDYLPEWLDVIRKVYPEVKVFGLTGRFDHERDATLKRLSDLNIHLDECYYTNGEQKGETFTQIVKIHNISEEAAVIFIDDSRENLDAVFFVRPSVKGYLFDWLSLG